MSVKSQTFLIPKAVKTWIVKAMITLCVSKKSVTSSPWKSGLARIKARITKGGDAAINAFLAACKTYCLANLAACITYYIANPAASN